MKLLVLDLDETLLFASEAALEREPDFWVDQYSVYKRPGLETFFATVREYFELAVWTSSNAAYAEAVVPQVFPSDLELKFVWSRERCTRKFDPELYEHEWAKNLSKVKKLGYRLEEVLMIDDTPAKLAQNYGNLVRVKPYSGEQEDAELVHLAKYLVTLATVPNVRAIEKRHWRTRVADQD